MKLQFKMLTVSLLYASVLWSGSESIQCYKCATDAQLSCDKPEKVTCEGETPRCVINTNDGSVTKGCTKLTKADEKCVTKPSTSGRICDCICEEELCNEAPLCNAGLETTTTNTTTNGSPNLVLNWVIGTLSALVVLLRALSSLSSL